MTTPGTAIPIPYTDRGERHRRASDAISYAAGVTGGDFGYLMRTAGRESGFNPTARNPRSSATGLFQFVEQTWLATVKRHGAAHGMGLYADAIIKDRTGRYVVADARMRKQILDLRSDPHTAAIMAAEHSEDNARYMRGKLGRDPYPGELYAAHFLGMRGAVRLINAVEASPNMAAAQVFPSAAGANKSMFYSKGRAVTVASLYERLTRERTPDTAAPVESDPRMYLAQAGGGASRIGADPVSTTATPIEARVVAAETRRHMDARLASVLSPTLAQILVGENSRFRKSFS